MDWQTFLSVTIFLLTLTLVIWRPKGLGIGFSALGGAILVLATNIVSPANLPAFVWIILANTTFTLLGLIGISWILQQTGIFRWLGLQVANWPLENGRLLFLILALLATLVTALFGNYGTILLFLPLVIEIIVLLGFNPTATFPFVIAIALIADTTSLAFTIGNSVNTIAANASAISFSRYAAVMFPVNLVAVVTTLAVLFFYFWSDIPTSYQNFDLIENGFPAALPPNTVKHSTPEAKANKKSAENRENIVLQELLTDNQKSSKNSVFKHLSLKHLKLADIIFHPFAQIVLFGWGIYVIVIGITNTILIAPLRFLFARLAEWGFATAIIGTGFLAALTAAVFNNLPATLINTLTIQSVATTDPKIIEATIYANVIGSAIGAKITPIGSLSSLLWMSILKRRGFHISWLNYCRTTLVLTLPILFVTLLSLIIWLSWLQTG